MEQCYWRCSIALHIHERMKQQSKTNSFNNILFAIECSKRVSLRSARMNSIHNSVTMDADLEKHLCRVWTTSFIWHVLVQCLVGALFGCPWKHSSSIVLCEVIIFAWVNFVTESETVLLSVVSGTYLVMVIAGASHSFLGSVNSFIAASATLGALVFMWANILNIPRMRVFSIPLTLTLICGRVIAMSLFPDGPPAYY